MVGLSDPLIIRDRDLRQPVKVWRLLRRAIVRIGNRSDQHVPSAKHEIAIRLLEEVVAIILRYFLVE